MVFVFAGLILSAPGFGLTNIEMDHEVLLALGEVALALILFNDAARMRLSSLKGNALPARMLAIGLPLTIALGAATALLLFTDLPLWEAAILATVLAPTDAGLGKRVVSSAKIPVRISQTLNLEAGLNDGIAVPFLLIFVTAAEVSTTLHASDIWLTFAAEIGFGILVGLGVGQIGGRAIRWATARSWMTETYRSLAFPVLALTAFFIADLFGGSGFIAAFTGGLTVAWVLKRVSQDLVGFIEAEGQVIDLGVFFIFGALTASLLSSIDAATVLYAVLSLTVIRMVPVAISLVGAKLQRSTILFLGWFGPRGLASIVLALLVVEQAPELAGLARIQLVMSVTVLMSVFAHGISTNPLIDRYGRQMELLADDAPEEQGVPHARVRRAA